MGQIELGYGRQQIPFAFDDTRFEVLKPADEGTAERPLSDAEIGVAIDVPIDSQPLEEILTPGESVLIVVSDATRATASAQIINLLVRRLVELGIAPYDIKIIFATGIHRAVTPAEKSELLTPFVVQRIKTLDHDAHDPAQHVALGTTERGTPIELNRALNEFSHVIVTGAIGFHYFAGFTGGRKSICPGLASARTIAATHLRALDLESDGRRAGVGAGRLDDNDVHEECERIAAEIAPSFLINTVVDERGRAVRVYAGDWRTAHRLACAEYANSHAIRITEKRPVVIASCGGAPYDINMIQAHKALDMATHACADNGTIILLAECADGFGRADFLKWFDADDSRELAARLGESYEVNGQTAWALLTKAERFRVHLVSRLAAEDVRRMRLNPARTVDEALAQAATDAPGYILPRGASLMPVVAGWGTTFRSARGEEL
ncbi:MAG: nickel-dependent lactate racemase [Pyrinomonadaceae bacterium]|nr:nickel-dependent lactate racemase [Pyrinomonadaceae bacterium]